MNTKEDDPQLLPPRAEKRPYVLEHHDESRNDPWYWLRDRSDPKVLAHLEAENAYTVAVTNRLGPLSEQLFEQAVGRILESDLSVPISKGPWEYYSRTEEAKQYAIHCRRPRSTERLRSAERPDTLAEQAGPTVPHEQVLLDENELAQGTQYFSLGGFSVSPNHKLAAYLVDTTGGEKHVLRIRDLQSGQDLHDIIDDAYYGLEWSADSSVLFYTRPDDAMRPWQLVRHRIGTASAEDVVAFVEHDERFYLGVGKTKDERFIVVAISSKITTEALVIDSDQPEETPRLLQPRERGLEYDVEHWGDRFLFVTNKSAENFRLCWAPQDTPGKEHWKDLLAYDPSVKLEGIDVFLSHLVLYERYEGVRRIRVASLTNQGDVILETVRPIPQPEALSTAWGTGNVEVDSTVLRYEYTSLITPRSIFEYDLRTGSTTLLKQQPVLGGYNPAAYKTWREWAKADDGELIPISLVARSDQEPNGAAPCLLYGYGSYEISIDPSFSSLRLSLLERGVVFAIAHVRGGGEMGRSWYTNGKFSKKTNTFTDFLAAARHLVKTGWAAPQRLVARGGSAGGLLMGAVANLSPAQFKAIVAEVPFVDCLTTMLDPSLPLTIPEWEEWGNPLQDKQTYRYLAGYSPYDNVQPQRYPNMLVTAGLEDPRVSYWEPTKWVAKLREASPQSTILLKVELGAGHMGPSGRYDSWREEAFVQAYILDQMGLV